MSARTRRTRRATAVGLVLAVTAGGVLLLTGCEPADPAQPTQTPGSSTTHPSTGVPSKPAPTLNGTTAQNHLTISNGTKELVMNGTVVDFGTPVRDLAWSPDGKKAAFVDGDGDLVVSGPDGSGRTVVAKHPAGEKWSHPAWQVTGVDSQEHITPKNNLFFVADHGGTTRLMKVAATGGTPEQLHNYTEGGGPELPITGNTWPNTGGTHGEAVYANTADGQVYVRDDYLRQQGFAMTAGSQPALSPDEVEVAFVRSSEGHDHLFVYDFNTRAAKDLTPHATTDYTEPAWSPDGRTIAVRTPDGIATLPANGSAAPTRISSYPGLPAYRP